MKYISLQKRCHLCHQQETCSSNFATSRVRALSRQYHVRPSQKPYVTRKAGQSTFHLRQRYIHDFRIHRARTRLSNKSSQAHTTMSAEDLTNLKISDDDVPVPAGDAPNGGNSMSIKGEAAPATGTTGEEQSQGVSQGMACRSAMEGMLILKLVYRRSGNGRGRR